MSMDEAVLAELKTTKATIDELQQKLKQLVAELRDQGASAQEIAEALRG
jgi:signal transduction histidine kinase